MSIRCFMRLFVFSGLWLWHSQKRLPHLIRVSSGQSSVLYVSVQVIVLESNIHFGCRWYIHWSWDKMAISLQTTYSNAFSWMKMYEFPIKISLKFVPKGSINNIPALVQIMAWRWPGDKPLSEAMMVRLLMHICVIQPQWVNISVYCRNSKIFLVDFFLSHTLSRFPLKMLKMTVD